MITKSSTIVYAYVLDQRAILYPWKKKTHHTLVVFLLLLATLLFAILSCPTACQEDATCNVMPSSDSRPAAYMLTSPPWIRGRLAAWTPHVIFKNDQGGRIGSRPGRLRQQTTCSDSWNTLAWLLDMFDSYLASYIKQRYAIDQSPGRFISVLRQFAPSPISTCGPVGGVLETWKKEWQVYVDNL